MSPDTFTTASILALLGVVLTALKLLYGFFSDRLKARPSLHVSAKAGRATVGTGYDPLTDRHSGYTDNLTIAAELTNTGSVPALIERVAIHPLFGVPQESTSKTTVPAYSTVEKSIVLNEIVGRAWRIDRLARVYRLEVRDRAGRSWFSSYVRVGIR